MSTFNSRCGSLAVARALQSDARIVRIAMPKKEPTASKSKSASAAPKRARATTAKSQPVAYLTDEQIRLRAYELYLQRDAAPGDPVADWLRAERELAAELTSAGRA